MGSLNSKRRRTWRSLPVLIAGLLAGAVLVQPAVAHVTKSLSHLTKHLDPRYYNLGEKVGDADTLDGVDSSGFARAGAAPSAHNHDDRYFTEAESDARYINTAEKAADSELLDGVDSSAFLQNQGSIKIVSLRPWKASNPAVTVDDDFLSFTQFHTTAAANADLVLVPEVPPTLYGKSLRLTGMQFCYDALHANVTLNNVILRRSYSNVGQQYFNNDVAVDTTDRDDNICRTYSGTPQTVPPNGWVEFVANVNWTGAGTFNVNRTTFFFEPTATEIAPPRQTSGSARERI
jgi:hypothetical protein